MVETVLHTGQHYDENMSHIFFDELGIPRPSVNLEISGGSHGEMTGRMLMGIEKEIVSRKPDWVLVYGDTNSTLAAALAASKLHVPVAHVEAGLRSFNRRMPEEINRVLTDHIAALLFCPTSTAVSNLADEGVTAGVENVGDVMYDAALIFGEHAENESRILTNMDLDSGDFALATVHRAENTDDPERLKGILTALSMLARKSPVVLPLHPRTQNRVKELELSDLCKDIRIIEPVSFLDMICLEKGAKVILTDSGGVQKEAYFHGVPCVTLRDETEWVETVKCGWNQLAGADSDRIEECIVAAQTGRPIEEYGNGTTAQTIVTHLQDQ
jgi:UDP-GlcNAc3NAcA epimerase